MEVVLEWVKSCLLFGIFASVIIMLSPNKTYMKHISLVIGMLFVLVMLHPIMELLELDGSTYLSYLKNYFAVENEAEITDGELVMYEESLSLELTLMLQREGFSVKEAMVTADEDGTVKQVVISFVDQPEQVEKLQILLVAIFGEETEIEYEMG